ncbi:WYL domain-containing protein [Sandaracinobacteroides hominis]|uniref:WYL domain-containing protein n=1 Tax=Sandaracinobacteroides hominis TaxID=2780086 RepID=UPI0018F32749|nr:WYL domain-containing protein [Sandaracinobacteroides hominis]
MRKLIVELWLEIRGHRVPVPKLRGSAPAWDAGDEPELAAPAPALVNDEGPPGGELDAIAGVCVEIVYCDSKGREAARRITCRTLTEAKGLTYLDAYCHEREAFRRFRCDRILEVVQLDTGECLVCDEFLNDYRIDRRAEGGISWGMDVRTYARFLNALRVLVFMGRCDHQWHPLEVDEIEHFIASYWMRTERPGEPPIDDMLAKARRMAPMPEEFFVALQSIAEDARLVRIIRPFLRSVVEADGMLADEEMFWGTKVDVFLAEAAA